MKKMKRQDLIEAIVREYRRKHRKSEAVFKEASRYQVRGGSHNLRLFHPFPFYDVRAEGSKIWDVDGHVYVDFWQGHYANILGHNPKIVRDALTDYLGKGQGLTTGFPGLYQKELARLISRVLPADKVRFTTSGTLASMYAVMLALAFTKREFILKAGGGWHGAHPYLLKGISSCDRGFDRWESAGVPSGMKSKTLITKFGDPEDLEAMFNKYGERTACFIVEPFMGSGGFLFASKEYIRKARELTRRFGAVLIFDEVVSAFRFHPGGIQSLYGIAPDLTVLGKIIGGGMPVAALAGREDIFELCEPERKSEDRVKFDGGTYCAHPASMVAGLTLLRHLIERGDRIYPRIGRLAEKVRNEIEKIFASHGFNVKCTGYGNAVTGNSSLIGVHFLKKEIDRIDSPEIVWNPALSDGELREKVFKLAMVNEGFNTFHGYGGISAAHTEQDISASLEAVERIAKKWKTCENLFA